MLRETFDSENVGDLVERLEQANPHIAICVGEQLDEDWQDEIARGFRSQERT